MKKIKYINKPNPSSLHKNISTMVNSDFNLWDYLWDTAITTAPPDEWTSKNQNKLKTLFEVDKRDAFIVYKDCKIIFGRWVYTSMANKIRLAISIKGRKSYSPYHTGSSTWELLSVTRSVRANASVKLFIEETKILKEKK